MPERQLQRIEAELRRRGRIGFYAGWTVALLFGSGMQLVAWLGKATPGEKVALSAVFAAIIFLPALYFIRPGLLGTPPLVARLRTDPRQLRSLRLQWMQYAAGPRGRLWFEFHDGKSYEVTLPVGAAREAMAELGAAYPWATG